ncbi:hypothetical protein LSH36_39g09000 [Paralvinella palmiformis]|uniref:Importin N-terminal domain-containing protein n=1 Tax=Paralvinella palmiformis TaxID=53620 RepID=A0AAD9K814_9ANNE|nr:hypothetical protein LSH36_39g09000 [Paralvinella palmiformis]
MRQVMPVCGQEAEKTLIQFASSPDCLNKCQLLLERGNSPYAQLLAATTLTKLVSRPNITLPLEQRVDIRNYVLNYLAAHPKLENFVSQALVQLFARITKQGWFDVSKESYVFRNVIDDIKQFLNTGSTHHMMMGVQLLSQLVCEMNQAEASRSLSKHRKIASSFRDNQLFEIFQMACNLLKSAYNMIKTINFSDMEQHGLLTHTLQLVLNCLTYDFIGTATDESADDLCTVQIPTNWRSVFLDGSTLQLFFDLYSALPSSLSPMAVSCLVQMASVRRSLFNNAERAKFLNQLVLGVKGILENPQGLSDPSNYHEFCRLLARLKSNYQLGELVKVDNYPEVIKLIAEFTVTSLRMWQFAPNSVHYLLSLWQRMVAPVPYVKASEPHLLETYTPEVTKAYITSRLDSVAMVIREGLDDPLDDQGMVHQQLDQLSTIGRYEYKKTCTLLVQLFDESAQRYQEALSQSVRHNITVSVEEGRLAWLVYIIGAVIGGRVSFASTEEHDEMDGELVCRVLQLMNLTDSRLAQGGCEKLDLALLSFFEQFRKIYVGDQVQKTSKVYRRLSDMLGLNDESMVLSVFIRKIITNLKYWGGSEAIISKTLQLLNDLSVGYSSVRKLVKLDAVQFMLNNHTSEHFPFLGVNNVQSQMNDMRCRTMFYTALGRLLMVELGEDEERFERFMVPLTAETLCQPVTFYFFFRLLGAFETLGTLMSQGDQNVARSEEAKRQLIGLARDLRGVAFAFNTKVSYMMLFEWIALELWYPDPAVTTPVLKLFAELAQNRSQRLQFDVSSPNGILLFREISKVIVGYGVGICFSMLKFALCGNYVNFGVFRLYGDDALDSALSTFIKMLLSISQNDLLDYPKLSQSYYALLECLAQDHMTFISNLEPQVFLYLMTTISEGLTALVSSIELPVLHKTRIADTMVCTGCCATLDNIITYLFKRLTRKQKKPSPSQPQDSEAFLRILEMHPEVLQQMLSTVLNIIMFEDCRNQWSMSRPLLGLILLNEEYFSKLRENLISGQPPDKQAAMARCFENLMAGVDRTLLIKNRDRFTQNLSVFRRDINDSMKTPGGTTSTIPPSTMNDMMS